MSIVFNRDSNLRLATFIIVTKTYYYDIFYICITSFKAKKYKKF